MVNVRVAVVVVVVVTGTKLVMGARVVVTVVYKGWANVSAEDPQSTFVGNTMWLARTKNRPGKMREERVLTVVEAPAGQTVLVTL